MPDYDPVHLAVLPDPRVNASPSARQQQQEQQHASGSSTAASLASAVSARRRSAGLLASRIDHPDGDGPPSPSKEQQDRRELNGKRDPEGGVQRDPPAGRRAEWDRMHQEKRKQEKQQRQRGRGRERDQQHQQRDQRVRKRQRMVGGRGGEGAADVTPSPAGAGGEGRALVGAAAGAAARETKSGPTPVVVPALGRPHRVVVVGAGFAGIAAALEMQKLGLEVVVLEVRYIYIYRSTFSYVSNYCYCVFFGGG